MFNRKYYSNPKGACTDYFRLILAICVSLMLFSCNDNSDARPLVQNIPPIANSGVDSEVVEGIKFMLSGSGSDPEGGALTYSWAQLSGPSVVFSSTSDPSAVIDIPRVPPGGNQEILLRITVSDSGGATSSDDLTLNVLSLYTDTYSKVNDCDTVATLPRDILNDDIGQSPRANRDAEVLALEASGEFTAPEGLYQRVEAELTGIVANLPELAVIEPRSCNNTGPYQYNHIKLDAASFQQVVSGSTSLLTPYFEHLGGWLHRAYSSSNTVTVLFSSLYNQQRILQDISSQGGVVYTDHQGAIGDGNDVCLAIRGATHFYIFDRGSGSSCPTGCARHDFTGVEVDASGNIILIGTFTAIRDPEPIWFENAGDCKPFLR